MIEELRRCDGTIPRTIQIEVIGQQSRRESSTRS